MKRRVAGIIAAVVLIGVVTWQLVDDDKSSAPDESTTTTTTVVLPPTTAPEQEPYASLAAVLPGTLDVYRVDTGAKATGALDLNAAVAAEADTQAERALLETRHFQAGYGRAFTNDTTDVYMVVYDFGNANDASLYLEDGMINLTGKGAAIYDVPEVPGGRGFSQGTQSDGRPAIVHGVAFSKADKFVLVFTRSPTTSTPTQAKDLAVLLHPRA